MLPSQKKSLKIIIRITIIISLLLYVFLKIDRDIKPLLFSVSSAEVRIIATEVINRAVKDELTQNVKYSDFVNVKTDKSGNISAIELNTVQMNKFGNTIALKIQEEMKFEGGRGIAIPMGVFTGSSILSYYGPKMNVKIMPMGSITTDFKSELQAAGINQTRYRVYICVNTKLQILIPFGKEKIDVLSTIPIAETLIVGKVPSSYFDSNSGTSTIPNVLPVPVK